MFYVLCLATILFLLRKRIVYAAMLVCLTGALADTAIIEVPSALSRPFQAQAARIHDTQQHNAKQWTCYRLLVRGDEASYAKADEKGCLTTADESIIEE